MRGAGSKPQSGCTGLVLPGSGGSTGLIALPPYLWVAPPTISSLGGSHPALLPSFLGEVRVHQAGEWARYALGSRPGPRHTVTHTAESQVKRPLGPLTPSGEPQGALSFERR